MFITRRIDIKENRSQNNQFLWKLELGKRRKNMYLDGVADEAKVNMMCWSWESEKTQMKRREVLLFEKLRMVLGFVTHRVSGSGRRLFNLCLGLFQGFQEDNMWTLFMWFKKKGFFEISIGRRWKGFFMNRSVWFERKTVMRDFHKNTMMIGVCRVVWVATNSIYLIFNFIIYILNFLLF
jgi:hypothetical protein